VIESIESYSVHVPPWAALFLGEQIMDKDRVEGSAKGIIGKIKEVAGKVLGDAKLESDGKADKAAGKVQNAVGGVKDTLKGK
jgi:uncharacterized protein YjbJ (UPF0337 family)